ncbi:GTP-binding protein [Candidatus Lokiarchaeum ossiferum]|uniref:GTP-binding protein n=1 Tax=Candidatus Lokiarchaeum ossiferum TaxID=2951803 RepID=UPI00352EE421
MVKVRNPQEIVDMVQKGSYAKKRVFSIVAHIDHGKTTTSDFLLKRAGLMRPEDAGAMQAMDSDDEEQARGITIFTSVVLLAFNDNRQPEDEEAYIFQINDTPGHLSFTGEVSRALRTSDGAILLVDALEGMMTQTETNIRLSVGNEKCKPVVFINKVDRLISELRLEPAEVYKRVDEIINDVNNLIRELQPEGSSWTVDFAKSQVALGSAKHGWGFTMEILKQNNIKPTFVFEKYNEGDIDFLRKNLPLDESLLRMVIDHLPDPITGSKLRMKHIVSGVDWDTEFGKSILNSDPKGELLGMIAKVFIDPKSFRPTLIGRVFSGSLHQGDTIYLVNQKKSYKVKRLGVMEITDLLDMDMVPAGNLFAVFGFICPSGESFVRKEYAESYENKDDIPRFESIKYSCEAVVSRSITPIDPQDLGKLGEVTSKWLMADNTAKFSLNKESKEYVLSGIDPLQIEILTKRINKQVKIKIGEPIIVYREMCTDKGELYYTKSPNGHNRMKMYIEPLDPVATKLSLDGEINEMMDRKTMGKILREKAGWDAKEARKIWDTYEGNLLVDGSKGLQRMDRIKSAVIDAFRSFCEHGPLAKEPVMGVKATFTDCTVHSDPAHTGFGEIATMVNANLALGFLSAKPKMFEPIQHADIKTPNGTEGGIIKVLTQHRGIIGDILPDGAYMRVTGKLPASELSKGIADDFRGATQGRAFFGYQFAGFEAIPRAIMEKYIMEIRKRKEMTEQMPDGSNFKRFIYVRT